MLSPVPGGTLLTHHGLQQWWGYEQCGAATVVLYRDMEEVEATAKLARCVRGPFIAASHSAAVAIYNKKRQDAARRLSPSYSIGAVQ